MVVGVEMFCKGCEEAELERRRCTTFPVFGVEKEMQV
jgi:hypothetical protein